MEYVFFAVVIGIVLAAGAYLEAKFGSKAVANVAADVAALKRVVASAHTRLDAVEAAAKK